MSTPSSASGVITDATSGLQGELMTIAGAGLIVGVALFGLRRGWSVIRGFVK
jgi:hypothetical protein